VRPPQDQIAEARSTLIEGIGAVSEFWGFGRASGQIYALLYFEGREMSLTEIAETLRMSKGFASLTMRQLERLTVVEAIHKLGNRQRYYRATDRHWEVVRKILKERKEAEFDRAIGAPKRAYDLLANVKAEGIKQTRERLLKLKQFYDKLDRIANAVLAIDSFTSGLQKLR